MADKDRAGPDELAIFIDGDDNYRILVPKDWADDRILPQLAYLSVAAVLRLATEDVEFARSLASWADEHLRRHNNEPIDLVSKIQKPN